MGTSAYITVDQMTLQLQRFNTRAPIPPARGAPGCAQKAESIYYDNQFLMYYKVGEVFGKASAQPTSQRNSRVRTKGRHHRH